MEEELIEGSPSPIHDFHGSQKPRVHQISQETELPSGMLGPVLHLSFHLLIHPGSQKTKDSLSLMHPAPPPEHSEECILLESHIVGALTWDIDKEVKNFAKARIPTPCAVGKMCVPSPLRDKLIMWAHTFPATGHPGSHRTHQLHQILVATDASTYS